MTEKEKLIKKILNPINDKNITFNEITSILNYYNFICRVKGDHHIYTRNDIEEIINIQPKGNMAKPYQVKQVRKIIQSLQRR